MPATIRQAISAEIAAAASAPDAADRWIALERAHILSQPWAIAHAKVHWRMLTMAVRQRDRTEAIGQVVRLVVAGPGSLSGRYPKGNTGRARVGLREPMAMPNDLAEVLRVQGT